MKYFAVVALFASGLQAQSPSVPLSTPPEKAVPADKVVARIDGRDVTMGEIRAALNTVPADLTKLYEQNPKYAIQQMYMLRHLAEEGEKLKLAEESPVKEQLAAVRTNVMAGAMLTYEQNHYSPSSDAIEQYYNANTAKLQRYKVKGIFITFEMPLAPNASFEERARAEANKAVGRAKRPEAEAQTRANEVLEKIRGGAAFADLVSQYSDDADSKARGGDIGPVTVDSPHADAVKAAVTKLQPGGVSDVIRLPGALVILKLEEKSAQPRGDAEAWIVQELRREHLKKWFTDLMTRFDPVITDPSAFPQTPLRLQPVPPAGSGAAQGSAPAQGEAPAR